jgi:cysteine desulfurase
MWQKNVRYLDYNASSGVSDSVRQKLTELLARSDLWFANPSSLHRPGQQSRNLLLKSGMKIAETLGKKVDFNQLVFTSSGTEANQTVIRSAMKSSDLIIVGAGEHSASHDLLTEIPNTIRSAELPLLSNGQYDLDALREILTDAKQSGCSSVFLSLFWANNETGSLTSLDALASVMKNSPVPVSLHLDGSQVWGKIQFDLFDTPADYVTFSGHKIGAPAGIGLIWTRPGVILKPFVIGSQAGGHRGGTENLLGIVALAFATEELDSNQFSAHTAALREHLEKGLEELTVQTGFPIRIWAKETSRITNTSRFSFIGFEGYQNWVELLDLRGFAISHGSACKSKVIEPSRVLLKMGASKAEALNAIRVSFGPSNQPSDVDDFIMVIQSILGEKRGRS